MIYIYTYKYVYINICIYRVRAPFPGRLVLLQRRSPLPPGRRPPSRRRLQAWASREVQPPVLHLPPALLVKGVGFRVKGLLCRAQGVGCGVYGAGCSV